MTPGTATSPCCGSSRNTRYHSKRCLKAKLFLELKCPSGVANKSQINRKETLHISSGYPGVIYSGDDFTVSSSGLTILETTIGQSERMIRDWENPLSGNNNKDLWQFVRPEGSVLEGVRATVANRLAEDGDTWTEIFSRWAENMLSQEWWELWSGTTVEHTTTSGWWSTWTYSNHW